MVNARPMQICQIVRSHGAAPHQRMCAEGRPCAEAGAQSWASSVHIHRLLSTLDAGTCATAAAVRTLALFRLR